MPALSVLICGGGIGGPAAAFWLARLGHACTVIERHPGLRDGGQQIDIRDQGVVAARRMGLLDEIRRRSVPEEGTNFVDVRGRSVAFFSRSGSEERQSWTSEFEIMRGDLCRILYDATTSTATAGDGGEKKGHGVVWRFGLTVEDLQHVDGGRRVRVAFSDGSSDEYDLVIGADGQGSRIRRKMIAMTDPTAQQQRPQQRSQDNGKDGQGAPVDSYRSLGVFCCYFNMPRDTSGGGIDDRTVFSFYPAAKRRVLATRWHSPDQGQGYMMTMSHADKMRAVLRRGGPDVVADQKALFDRVFSDAGWQAERLVREMHRAEDIYAFEAVQVTAPAWSRGRVVLLGDAAHAPSFFTGMGTSLALAGAYVLAGELARHPDDISAALAAYDRQLRPLVEKVQQLPRGFPGLMFPKSTWAVKLMHWILMIMAFVHFDTLSSKFGGLFGRDGKKWELPEYHELEREKGDLTANSA